MRMSSLLATLPVFLLTGLARGQSITVTTSADVSDFASPRTIAQLPGPDGVVSFREAAEAADNTPGSQTIGFAVPRGQWNDQFFPGRVMLDMQGPIVLAGDDTIVDFTTQLAFSGDTNPAGNEVGMQYYGPPSNISFIFVIGHRNTIRGLDATTGNAFGAAISISGNGNIVEQCTSGTVEIKGNFGGPAATGNLVRENRLYEVAALCWADGNIITGNRLTHVRIEGSRYCVYPTGNRVGGPAPEDRNVISGYGRYGEEAACEKRGYSCSIGGDMKKLIALSAMLVCLGGCEFFDAKVTDPETGQHVTAPQLESLTIKREKEAKAEAERAYTEAKKLVIEAEEEAKINAAKAESKVARAEELASSAGKNLNIRIAELKQQYRAGMDAISAKQEAITGVVTTVAGASQTFGGPVGGAVSALLLGGLGLWGERNRRVAKAAQDRLNQTESGAERIVDSFDALKNIPEVAAVFAAHKDKLKEWQGEAGTALVNRLQDGRRLA